jgi:hypothetical protein
MPVLVISGYAEDDGIAPDLPKLTKPRQQGELDTRLAESRRALVPGSFWTPHVVYAFRERQVMADTVDLVGR